MPDTVFILIFIYTGSNGIIRKDLENLSTELGISSNVEFFGFVDKKDVLLCYKSSDIFVLPSFSEAFPMVILA